MVLKCISCGREFPEVFNYISCPHCSTDEIHNWLYSTSLKVFPFKESPLQKIDKTNDLGKEFWLKREDKNPFGTFKDRKSNYIKCKFRSIEAGHEYEKIQKFALASSGNMAISFGSINSSHPCFTRLFVSPHINLKKLQALQKLNYREINFTDKILTTDELTNDESDRWNITNGMDPIGASAYYSLGLELEPYDFDNIIVPCGSGELYSALAIYFHILRGKDRPYIYPITSNRPEADAIRTSFVASEPLIYNLNSYDWGDTSIDGVESYDDAERLKYFSDCYNCEYSSAVVFAAFEKLELKGKTCLIVTGAKK
jgi:threonine synthase